MPEVVCLVSLTNITIHKNCTHMCIGPCMHACFTPPTGTGKEPASFVYHSQCVSCEELRATTVWEGVGWTWQSPGVYVCQGVQGQGVLPTWSMCSCAGAHQVCCITYIIMFIKCVNQPNNSTNTYMYEQYTNMYMLVYCY